MRGYLRGHLGVHIAALVDGQMAAREQERAWSHVLACPACRREVELEGWAKSRVAGLGEPVFDLDRTAWVAGTVDGPGPRSGRGWATGGERRGGARMRVASAGTVSVALAGVVVWGVTAGAAPKRVDLRVPREASFGGGVSRVADAAFFAPTPAVPAVPAVARTARSMHPLVERP